MKFNSSFGPFLNMVFSIFYLLKTCRWGRWQGLQTEVGALAISNKGKKSDIFRQLQTITVFFLSCTMFCFSCKSDRSHSMENVVYYFPEKNSYYDSQRSNYYYSLDGGHSWDSMAFKGSGYGTVLGPKIPIERTQHNVWENNESHRKEYAGVLLNIVNNQTISLSKADSINKITAAPPKTQQEVVVKEEPPKKGLKKFLNKLFGKKNKPAEGD